MKTIARNFAGVSDEETRKIVRDNALALYWVRMTGSEARVGRDRGEVGFVGLGTMGKPMATNLVRAGLDVLVFDLDPAPVAELVALGARSAPLQRDRRTLPCRRSGGLGQCRCRTGARWWLLGREHHRFGASGIDHRHPQHRQRRHVPDRGRRRQEHEV